MVSGVLRGVFACITRMDRCWTCGVTDLREWIVLSHFCPAYHCWVGLVSGHRHRQSQVSATPPQQGNFHIAAVAMVTVVTQFLGVRATP